MDGKKQNKRRDERIISLFCSDLHLSHNAPVFRSNEPNWYEAMLRPIEELKNLQREYDCPVFCAGDIFDKWNAPAQLINFALKNLPEMYAVPGQHDLPDHSLKEVEKSAFWTLVQAGKIKLLSSNFTKAFFLTPNTHVSGFAFGEKIVSGQSNRNLHHIAIIHQYNWIPKCNYIGARTENLVSTDRKEFEGYDLVVSGDNHQWFKAKTKSGIFWNCGSLMRRHANEKHYFPTVGMLTENGQMFGYDLSISSDKYIEVDDKREEAKEMDLQKLVKSLRSLNSSKTDFVKTVEEFMQKYGSDEEVQKIMATAMGLK